METNLSSLTKTVVLSPDTPVKIIGERINPTGRKALAAEMAEGNLQRVADDALAQVAAGAAILDVNAGVPMVDEPNLLAEVVKLVQSLTDVPLCIDSALPEALEAGLEAYEGKALVNSVNGETIYTPPPAHDVPIMMAELVKYLNSEAETHLALVSGIAQFQLVHIHPFLDGNGRTSRLLSTLCLYRAGYDFRRLFTISEYYDRDRPAFYRAIQSVRESDMDMTAWLEYFIEGLTIQLAEIRGRGELAIRRDVLVKEHGLSDRQSKALARILEHGSLTIQDLERLCPEVNRRTLQRDLKVMIDKGVLKSEGATHHQEYRLN